MRFAAVTTGTEQTPKLTSSASITFSGRSSCLGLQRQKRTSGKKGRAFHKSQGPESGLIWLRSQTLLYSRKGNTHREGSTYHIPLLPCQGPHKWNHTFDKYLQNSLSLSDFDNKGRHVEGCDSTCFWHTTLQLVCQAACLLPYQSIWLSICTSTFIDLSMLPSKIRAVDWQLCQGCWEEKQHCDKSPIALSKQRAGAGAGCSPANQVQTLLIMKRSSTK